MNGEYVRVCVCGWGVEKWQAREVNTEMREGWIYGEVTTTMRKKGPVSAVSTWPLAPHAPGGSRCICGFHSMRFASTVSYRPRAHPPNAKKNN